LNAGYDKLISATLAESSGFLVKRQAQAMRRPGNLGYTAEREGLRRRSMSVLGLDARRQNE
jgi:hypothetical protein